MRPARSHPEPTRRAPQPPPPSWRNRVARFLLRLPAAVHRPAARPRRRGRSPRRSRRARARAPRRGSSAVRSAMASFPAGTAARRSRTTSSGVSSSSRSAGESRKISGSTRSSARSSSSSSRTSTAQSSPSSTACALQLLEPAVVLVQRVEDEEVRVGYRGRALERHVGAPEDRERARVADCTGIDPDDERLGALFLRRSGGVRILDGRDDGDPVALGDRVAEAALRHPCARSVSSAHRPIGCHTVFSSRKPVIWYGLGASGRPLSPA